jgi:thiosulfate/3-mercaptopyruvate sulfurtransferase
MSYKTIISQKDLKNNISNNDFIIFDTRCDIKDSGYGIDSYTEGHIENSIFVDVDTDLASEKQQGTGRHPLPKVETFCDKLSHWGMDNNKQVVIYDDAGGAFAGRMWWMLRWLGHEHVAVLDGGLNSWVKNGNKLITSPTLFKKSYFEPTINNEMIATLRDVENAQHVLNTILLDARSKERYEGISDPVDPIAGHVPGAISHPLGTNLDRTGKFKDKEELKHNFDKISHDLKEKEIISMCGSGITACHNILALEIAGIKNAKLYVGSWSEWITDPNRTVVTIKSS